jgi:thiol-disulfide isomerase/thioredoxin
MHLHQQFMGESAVSNIKFNNMKFNVIIILNLLFIQQNLGQTGPGYDNKSDPFCRMVQTVYSQDALSFNSRFRIKQLFEKDTVSSEARVTVIKKGTDISFLRIIPDKGNKELLFYHDSAWFVDHLNHEMDCLGTNTDDLTHNSMSQFFPFMLYNLDTMISHVKPFWKVVAQTEEFTAISLDIAGPSKDVSDIKIEFSWYNSSLLPYSTLQESVYMKADKLFQEQIFSGYEYPCPERIKIPGYFSSYIRDLSAVRQIESPSMLDDEEPEGEVFLNDIELFDMAGIPVTLPDNGLILLDLWYVGCPPCIKSAPVIEKLYREYNNKVHFFSIDETDSDTAKIARFKNMMGVSFPVLMGHKEKLAMKINGSGAYPVFILLDAGSKKILWKYVGYNENLYAIIKDAIERQL